MAFKVGDWIEHAGFGHGLITAERDPYFTIRFVTGGEKNLKASFITNAGAPPHPGFTFNEAKRAKGKGAKGGKAAGGQSHSFEHLHERFLALYPGGFDDAKFRADEGSYKQGAIDKFNETLSHDEMQRMLQASEYEEIAARAKQCASWKGMNLIFPQERMSLSEALKGAEGQQQFSLALFDVLYGTDPMQQKFEKYAAMLDSIGCPKWTVATFFQFLATDGEAMFMKPMVAQVWAAALGVDLHYSVELNWTTYEKLLETAKILKERLEAVGMVPRNGVDLQGFMYVAWQQTK